MKDFRLKQDLSTLIESYFSEKTVVNVINKVTDPPTIGGLVVHLGFQNQDELDRYEACGKFGKLIKQARYKVMVYYEQRLSYPSATGAMFALKSLGWVKNHDAIVSNPVAPSINISLIETGPEPASSEKEVNI